MHACVVCSSCNKVHVLLQANTSEDCKQLFPLTASSTLQSGFCSMTYCSEHLAGSLFRLHQAALKDRGIGAACISVSSSSCSSSPHTFLEIRATSKSPASQQHNSEGHCTVHILRCPLWGQSKRPRAITPKSPTCTWFCAPLDS